MSVQLRQKYPYEQVLTPNDTLTSGVTKSNATLPIVSSVIEYGAPGISYHETVIQTNSLVVNIPADAALGLGEHIATFPKGLIQPLGAYVKMTSLCPTGLSATAGEVGLGTTIASGAIATLGAGSAAMENIMEGTTISNHVAATTLTSKKFNAPVAAFDHGATQASILDGSSTAVKLHLNLASTWNQTSAENVTFSALIRVHWIYLGDGA